MSTRATYEFRHGRKTLATFYIHHDGYPDGAATYFQAAATYEGRRSYLNPTRFFRANDRAELTAGHSAHGDTEYQYVVMLPASIAAWDNWDQATITCRSVEWSERKCETVFKGTFSEFYKRHGAMLESAAADE